MYASRTTQFIVGIFALIGIAALAFLSLRLGRIELFPTPGYTIYANFDNISGLKMGDRVEIAGVQIGKVVWISLHQDRAHVGMRLNGGVKVDDQSIVSIKSSGIIGDRYVSIAPGGGDHMVGEGGTVRQTESAFVIEDVLGNLINNAGRGEKTSADKDGLTAKDKK